jgi:hypothetical protein
VPHEFLELGLGELRAPAHQMLSAIMLLPNLSPSSKGPRPAMRLPPQGHPCKGTVTGERPSLGLEHMPQRLDQERLDSMQLAVPYVLDLFGDVGPVQLGFVDRSPAALRRTNSACRSD